MGHLSRLIRFDVHSLKKAHHPAHLKTAGSWKSLLQNAHFSQLYGSSVACCQNPWDNVFTPRREGNSEKRKSQRIVTHQFCSRRILQNNCVLWNWPAVSLKEANIKLQLCRARGTWFSCTYKINFSKLHFRVHTMQPSPSPSSPGLWFISNSQDFLRPLWHLEIDLGASEHYPETCC